MITPLALATRRDDNGYFIPEPPRLTWPAGGPLPYESGWMVFIKLMCLNLITPRVLRSTICQPFEGYEPLDWVYSGWIDFARFSGALGVPELDLRRGFLDQLGIYAHKLDAVPTVFHCPDCIEIGFHCVLFELALIGTCPWHGKRLVGCRRCAMATRTNRPRLQKTDHDSLRARFGCDHFKFDTASPRMYNHIDKTQREDIAAGCRDLLRWIDDLAAQGRYSRQLMARLWDVGGPPYEREVYAVSQSIAARLAGPCPWEFSNPSMTVCVAAHPKEPFTISPRQQFLRASSDLGRVYEAIRASLFKEYVEPHASCWKSTQTQFSRPYFRFDAHCCTPTIAYLAWRYAIEGKESIFAGRDARQYRLPRGIPLHGPSAVANAYMLLFFAIWEDTEHWLDLDRGSGAKRIHVEGLGKTRFSVLDLKVSKPPPRKVAGCSHIWIAFIDVPALRVQAQERCADNREISEKRNDPSARNRIVYRGRFETEYLRQTAKLEISDPAYEVFL